MESKMLNKDEILKNLKGGIDDLNTKFDSEDWDQIEVRVSEFENDVLKCLMNGADSQPTQMPVIGDLMYSLIKEKFEKELSQFMDFKVNKTTTETTDSEESQEEKPKNKKKEKKEKKQVVKKADLIRQENAIASVKKQITQVLESFNENKMIYDFGLYTNKIVELRGLTFVYMAWFVLKSKSSSEYQKKSKLPEVYELMCSMQRFINTCKDYSGKSLANSMNTEKVSETLIKDVEHWLNKLKSKYPFDGITIYNVAPKLLIHSTYDDAIPNRAIKIRPNQKQLMDSVSANPDGFLLFYNAAIASGKTTLASVGIASHIDKLRKSGKIRDNTQLLFCCNLASVRRQVAKNCWNAGIKFAIGSYIKSTNSYKLTNHWGTKDEDRIVIVAGPDVIAMLLEEDNKKIREDAEKPEKERRYYTGKYWLFLDEPTVGADIMGSKYLDSNIRVMCTMPKWSILSSATMPTPDKITDIITYHRNRFPDVFIDTQVTKEISIGCDAKTFDNDMVVPHIGCVNKEQLETCIRRINEVPFLGRLYTHKVAEQLWKDMTSNKIDSVPNIKEYFANVDNLSADKVRKICLEMLTLLSNEPNAKIKKICSSKIFADVQEVKEKEDKEDKVINHVEFSRFGTSEAAKYLNMNLVVSTDPIHTAKVCFSELLENVRSFGIDITRLRNFISAYEKKLAEYHKTRDYLAKSLDIKENEEQVRKLIHFEEEANKRGCGQNDLPTLDFPREFQINTLAHWKKYGSHYQVNAADLRPSLDITTIPVSTLEVEDWLAFLLFCGVGVYAPYQIKDPVYLREVLTLAEAGKLAFLVSDSSICYGTNYPINRVFITKEFSEIHSINTLFQLMGRAGRAGQSWKAEIYFDKSIALKLIDFVQNPADNSGEIEAKNMSDTFNVMIKATLERDEAERIRKEEEERRLIEEALAQKRKLEEAAKLRRIQKEKEELEKTLKKPQKIVAVHEIVKPENKKSYASNTSSGEGKFIKFGEWKKKDNGEYKPRESYYKPRENNGEYKPRDSYYKPRENNGEYKPRDSYYKPRENNGEYKPRDGYYKPRENNGEYKPKYEHTGDSQTKQPIEPKPSGYIPPWKKAGTESTTASTSTTNEASSKFSSFKPVKKQTPEQKKDSDKDGKLSWRK